MMQNLVRTVFVLNTGDKPKVIFFAFLGLVHSSQDQLLQHTDPKRATAYSQGSLLFVPKAGLDALNRWGQGPLPHASHPGWQASIPWEQGEGRVEEVPCGGIKAQPGKFPTRFCWQAVTGLLQGHGVLEVAEPQLR